MKPHEEYVKTFSVALMADIAQDPDLSIQVIRGDVSGSKLGGEVLQNVVRGAQGGRIRFPHVQRLIRQRMDAEKRILRDAGVGAETPVKAESNIWDAIGGAITGAAAIASSVLTKKYEASGDKAVAALNAQSQQLSLQAQQIAAQTAARIAAGPTDGVPGWVIPTAIGSGILAALGGIIYAATRRGR